MAVETYPLAYAANQSHHTRAIWLAILLALLLHVLTLIAFSVNTKHVLPREIQSIEVSLDTPLASSPPLPKKRITPPKPKPTPPPPPPIISELQPTEAPTPAVKPLPTPAVPLTPPAPPTPTPEPTPPVAQPLSSLSRMPGFKRKVQAVYPASERRAGIQAKVLAEVTIDAEGKVETVRIIKSAGKAFDLAVIEALQKSVFTPGYIGDEAVPVHFQIPFRFNLN